MKLLHARYRPMVRVETLVLIVAAFMVVAANGAWWQALSAGRAWTDVHTWLIAICCFVMLVALHFALLAPLAIRWLVRPLLTLVVIAAGAAAYYTRQYDILFDPDMIGNVLHTDAREAAELLTWRAPAWVLAWSALPVGFIWLVRIERHPWMRALMWRVGLVLLALVVAVLALLPVSRDFSALMREQREMRYLVTPGNLFYGLAMQLHSRVEESKLPRAPLGRDARVVRLASQDKTPHVFVLVVGETARAANFSLLGYRRETNPELAKMNVIAFQDVTACGTSTEVSVPCMFSPFGRENYDRVQVRRSETLLDVLVHAGYRVKWIDNQSGCKGVCQGAGVEYEKIESSAPGLCDGQECLDEALVLSLRRELAQVRQDTVLVLHMMGNHGPAYHKRYPARFRRFLPDCLTSDLRDCDRQQVINSYDNAILYTDHVLAGVVHALRDAGSAIDSAMMYVSDHGESLGEKGLYLHGMPYAIAPSEQLHVPLMLWLSPQTVSHDQIDVQCLRRKAREPATHDHVFHTVLGLLDVHTLAYWRARDLFDGCRGDLNRMLAKY